MDKPRNILIRAVLMPVVYIGSVLKDAWRHIRKDKPQPGPPD